MGYELDFILGPLFLPFLLNWLAALMILKFDDEEKIFFFPLHMQFRMQSDYNNLWNSFSNCVLTNTLNFKMRLFQHVDSNDFNLIFFSLLPQ